MAETVFTVLEKRLKEQMRLTSEQLISGGIKDYTQYKDAVGFIRGLETAIREIKDLARNMEDDNDI